MLESVQKPDLETIIDKVVKIYDALMYIQGEYKKATDQNKDQSYFLAYVNQKMFEIMAAVS